jgi:hypothetical protein
VVRNKRKAPESMRPLSVTANDDRLLSKPSRSLFKVPQSLCSFSPKPSCPVQSNMSPIPAVLLRPSSRSCSTSSPDPYAYLLSQPPTQFPSKQPSYQPYFQPLFETAFDNESELEGIIWSGGEPWGGVVVTSQRAVEAWEKAARKVAEGGGKGKRRESSRDSGEDDLVDGMLSPARRSLALEALLIQVSFLLALRLGPRLVIDLVLHHRPLNILPPLLPFLPRIAQPCPSQPRSSFRSRQRRWRR